MSTFFAKNVLVPPTPTLLTYIAFLAHVRFVEFSKCTDKNHFVSKRWLFTTHRAPVAQMVEHGAVMREVVSSTPAGPTLRVLK